MFKVIKVSNLQSGGNDGMEKLDVSNFNWPMS